MNAQHTPGPWKAESAKDYASGRHDDKRWTVHANGMPLIAIVDQYRGQAQANARLIASAPELLAALERVAEDLEYFASEVPPSKDECGAMAKAARAAIAKAKGGAL